MIIRYTVCLEDLKACQGVIRSTAEGFRVLQCVRAIGGPVLLLILVWIFTESYWGWWPTLVAALPAAMLGIHAWRASSSSWSRANLDALYDAGKLNLQLGEHSLELKEDGLLEPCRAGEHLARWDQIAIILSKGGHTFIITKAESAYVLPESSVIEGDYEAFVQKAIRQWSTWKQLGVTE